jgi:hypothetical protein
MIDTYYYSGASGPPLVAAADAVILGRLLEVKDCET